MKEYNIPIRWESYKRISVEAENLQSAVYLALKQFLAEPDELYINDSFEIDEIVEEDYPDEELDMFIIYENL
jgi:hypothetical protein